MSRMASTLGKSLNMILDAALETLTRNRLPSVYTKTTSGRVRRPASAHPSVRTRAARVGRVRSRTEANDAVRPDGRVRRHVVREHHEPQLGGTARVLDLVTGHHHHRHHDTNDPPICVKISAASDQRGRPSVQRTASTVNHGGLSATGRT